LLPCGIWTSWCTYLSLITHTHTIHIHHTTHTPHNSHTSHARAPTYARHTTPYPQAFERNAILANELDEKQRMAEMCQKLKDEVRVEMHVVVCNETPPTTQLTCQHSVHIQALHLHRYNVSSRVHQPKQVHHGHHFSR